MCVGFTCESRERESRWVTPESGCCIKGHFTKRQITRGMRVFFLYTVTGHSYAPHTLFYAICLHSPGSVPLLSSWAVSAVWRAAYHIAVDYDTMTIYKHLCHLLNMRSSKVLANRDKKRFPISRSKHTSHGQSNKASEQSGVLFPTSCVMLQWLNSTECFPSGGGIV